MKLYLASYAKVTLDKILENEGGNFSGRNAVFIPTAGDPYENRDFVVADRDALLAHGLNVIDLDIKNAKQAEISEKFTKAEIVLVAGGDTFYLMDAIRKTGVDEAINNFLSSGGIYIGSSAGSIICCPTISGAEEFDDPGLAPDLKDYRGLDVCPDVIIPHAQKAKYSERIKRATTILETQGYKVYALTDDEVLFYNGQDAVILK